ncbi:MULTISPECIES: hypothetical protein [Pseudomonas]|uniref:hypothetical protein n=1 Tax=Pseudomonas TaxID=286 RepID=UPI001F01EF2D|nr:MULTISPECIES: hypothetical protein [Pseudomonas]MCG8292168.1 hypothetical protein [Pseudomonas entomophila]
MVGFSRDEIVSACLMDFRDSGALHVESYLDVLLECLLQFEGVGIEMSGVYIQRDEDLDNIPRYLIGIENGMAFEFIGEVAIYEMSEGARRINEWCEMNVSKDKREVMERCQRLMSLYGGCGE